MFREVRQGIRLKVVTFPANEWRWIQYHCLFVNGIISTRPDEETQDERRIQQTRTDRLRSIDRQETRCQSLLSAVPVVRSID